jgi:predicted RNA-binding protein with PIN domain
VRWVVDASNVIGSRPDGWWRDRAGATERLLDDLGEFAERAQDEVLVVLDADPARLAERSWPGLEVVVAERRGRDAADDAIVARLERDADPGSVRVVTSDAGLADRVRALGASVEGARTFRERQLRH